MCSKMIFFSGILHGLRLNLKSVFWTGLQWNFLGGGGSQHTQWLEIQHILTQWLEIQHILTHWLEFQHILTQWLEFQHTPT